MRHAFIHETANGRHAASEVLRLFPSQHEVCRSAYRHPIKVTEV